MKEGWEIKKIVEICLVTDYVANGSFKSLSENVKYNYEEDYAILLRTTDFTNNFKKDFVYVNQDSYEFLKKSTVYPNDIVICNVGSVGLTFKVPDLKRPMTIGPNSILVRPLDNKELDNNYMYYLIASPYGQKLIDSITTGTTQSKFNKTNFRQLEIPVPPLPEQERIVSILDQAFAAIEKAKANAEQNLKNAKELFESYLQGVFEKKGDGWEEKTLGEIADVEYGYTDKSTEVGDYRYVRITDIDKNGELILEGKKYIKYSKEAEEFLIQENDLLMARTGATFAKVLLYNGDEPSVFASYLIRIKFKEKIENALYWYFTKTINYWEQANSLQSGAAQPHFNGAAVKQVVFAYPKSVKEQKTLIENFETLSIETKKLEAVYQKKMDDLEELKKSILQKAFAGELKVSEPLINAD